MFRKRRLMAAMKAADGLGEPRADEREVARFRELSALVRDASATSADPPAFEFAWAAIERRAEAARGAPESHGFLARMNALLGERPLLVLAPAGTMIVAAVLGALLWLAPAKAHNECYVDSSDVETGSVLVDQDMDDPDRPTVIWHIEEG